MAGSGPTWYGPTEEWPDHPKPWFRKALSSARAAGWWYRKAANSAHIHGTAFCKRAGEGVAHCKFLVFSSGSAGETKAQELERLIGRCPHNREAVDVLAAAGVQMDKADRLCQGAEALLDMYDYEQKAIALLDKANNLLEEADQGVSEVDDLLCEACNVEAEARAASDHAEQSLTLAMTQLRDPGQVLDLADSTTSHVQTTLRTEKPSAEVRDLRKRVRKTRDKIKELKIRAHHT